MSQVMRTDFTASLLQACYGHSIGQGIIFLSCGYYLLFFLACSQWSQVDVYHTSTHDVAVVALLRI